MHNVKVIASNCVNSPKGCTLFTLHDKMEFRNTLIDIKSEKESEIIINGALQIIDLYRYL